MEKLFFILMIMTIMITGCEKEKSKSLPVYSIPQYWKDYAYFKTGTYWIYLDSVSGLQDCVYVTENHNYLDTLVYDDELGVYEYIGYTSVSSFDGFNYYVYLNTTWYDKKTGSNVCWIDKAKPGKYIGLTILMFAPFQVGDKRYPYSAVNSTITLVNNLSSLNVDTNQYQNVLEFNDNENVVYDKNQTNIYIAKNVGVIRKELIDSNRVWNLIDKNIMQ